MTALHRKHGQPESEHGRPEVSSEVLDRPPLGDAPTWPKNDPPPIKPPEPKKTAAGGKRGVCPKCGRKGRPEGHD